MYPFHTVTIPHKDIIEGRLTMDVFAADLSEVSQNKGHEEYRDPDIFFQKTYLTEGLKNLLSIVEKRLKGLGGDPVIQLQTPFGGGKTHALIAIYHKAKEWGAKRIVMVGTALTTYETLWGTLEQQLTGKIEEFTDKNWSKSKKEIKELLESHQPVVILMDEILEYATRAAGVTIGESTLAAQTIAFIQELTEAVASLEKACLVVTLPSSVIEHYDESAERLYQQLQRVSGRVEKIYTPVNENEIAKVVRRRLFLGVDESKAKEIVSWFVNYADREGILPEGVQPSEYRDRFLDSYPFMPEVLDVLYHRWGSFPNFQRTRGVLRILSLVIHSLKDSEKPYISLADFDLSNETIRQEFLKHIGTEFNSVLAQDITDSGAGAKKVDKSLGDAYQGLNMGTRTASTIFLYSFSGGQEKGINLRELKRCASVVGVPATLVSEAVEQLRQNLFYLQSTGDRFFFSNQPNINRIILTEMENIKDEEAERLELDILKQNIKGDKLKVFIWEEDPSNIPDSEELKLVVLKRDNKERIQNILRNKGATPRVNRNTIFFLYPMESERSRFTNTLLKKIAYERVERNKDLQLSEEQRREVREKLKEISDELNMVIRALYRLIGIPAEREEIKVEDLGIPTYGDLKPIDYRVYERLKALGEILEKIAPLVIKEKYLVDRDYVSTKQIYQSTLTTPGQIRFVSRDVLVDGIIEGVEKGIFGLGELSSDKLICSYFKEKPSVSFADNEVLIRQEICEEQRRKIDTGEKTEDGETGVGSVAEKTRDYTPPTLITPPAGVRKQLSLTFEVPQGKLSDIMPILRFIQSKFGRIRINLTATDGEISEDEYDMRIKEAFEQARIDFEER
ncbi:Predicted ATPase, AAA+ superfamily [Fervidobacterium changbaicum]|uniref:AAA family ATPase n=1 Tax=Fervidobacterium changbaicum TaxID=310769 RepID=A0ABX5QRX4_9BACT|nr:DUF499 domain-containing protein [Fervidobacterium changbaicum]QAV33174.1 AAA family ATPase [Fervidobacterium changbaicum]SDH12644.1 Predicted ATPase, AAA+ superfamily [Fervidobacterium changbaicum]